MGDYDPVRLFYKSDELILNKPRMLSHPFAIVIDVNIDREEQTVFWRQLEWIILRVEFSISVNSLRTFKIRYLENEAIYEKFLQQILRS